jgi:transposase
VDQMWWSAGTRLFYRRLLKLTLEELQLIEDHLGQLDQQMADLLTEHYEAVQRLAEVPGLGVDSAQQIIAEVGPPRRRFLPRSISRRGWAPAPGARRVRARTTVIAAPKAIDRCGASSIRPPTPP